MIVFHVGYISAEIFPVSVVPFDSRSYRSWAGTFRILARTRTPRVISHQLSMSCPPGLGFCVLTYMHLVFEK
jgi:hypothetical protein